MDRRGFLLAAAAAPLAARGRSFAYVTADTEAHVAIVELESGRVLHRIATRPGPRSVERIGAVAVVAHTAIGAVSVVDELGVRREVPGFEEPRYTAGSHDGRHAFVTDANLARTRVSFAMPRMPGADDWHHIAFAWDETVGVRLYVDGDLAASLASTTTGALTTGYWRIGYDTLAG